ncbi:WD40-repeat-containing domain protein, partial [Suillus occidentalis]
MPTLVVGLWAEIPQSIPTTYAPRKHQMLGYFSLLRRALTAHLTVRGCATLMQTAVTLGQRAHITQGQSGTLTRTIQGHMESVDAAAFFSDGRRVVTGSWDHTLQIWDVQEGLTSIGGPLWGHNNRVLSVAVSPDDRRIASGGVDKTIIIWDVE